MVNGGYAIVAGQGRSGTSWLLDLFDLSPETFCRNEPYRADGSPLVNVSHDRRIRRRNQVALHAEWDEAVRWVSTHMGERDRVISMPKSYLYPLSRAVGFYRMVRGPRLRRTFSIVMPALRCGEWPLPWFLGTPRRLDKALPVLKLVQAPGWVDFALNHRHNVQVFHIVRHPGGFLNSWLNRYLNKSDKTQATILNRQRLEQIAREEPIWGDRFGDVKQMSAEEAELWYWCYANEVIYSGGQDKKQYHLVIYERLAADPVPTVKQAYQVCGLDWSEPIEQAVMAVCSRSKFIAASWREKLNADQIAVVERIRQASLMGDWWDAETMESSAAWQSAEPRHRECL